MEVCATSAICYRPVYCKVGSVSITPESNFLLNLTGRVSRIDQTRSADCAIIFEKEEGLARLVVLARIATKEGGTSWPKSHVRTRAALVRQSRGRNFVRPIVEKRNPAFPAPVATRDAEESRNR